jgi:intein/homing endonuclease
MTKRGFVRGYFDADGYPNLNKARRKVLVQVNSVNKFGLSDVQSLLRTIGFHPGLYRRYKKREVWELVIHRKSEVIRFLDEVGFAIRRKQDKLQEMIGQMKLR